jgi:hypothetical protein
VKKLQIKIFLAFIICLNTFYFVFGQTPVEFNNLNQKLKTSYHFKVHPNQKLGFDEFEYEEWKNNYYFFKSNENQTIIASHVAVPYNEEDKACIVVRGSNKKSLTKLKILNGDIELSFESLTDSTISINLPKRTSDYSLKAILNDQIVSFLNVHVYKKKKESIIIVPLAPIPFSIKDIEKKLNSIYKQANIGFDIQLASTFKSEVFESSTLFSPPVFGKMQYTGQMRLLRDLYFETHPKKNREKIYIFVIEGFEDSLLNGFVAQNKSLLFVKSNPNFIQFSSEIAKLIGGSTLKESWLNDGPAKGSTDNLMDSSGFTKLNHVQWKSLRNRIGYYSYFDNEENVQTKNGTVAYYFWKENQKGVIKFKNHNFLTALKRPYKQNFLSYRFKVKYFVLRPFYKIGNYYISIIDLIFTTFTLLILWFIRRKIVKYWKRKKIRFIIFRRMLFASILLMTMYQIYENYWITNQILNYFKQISGPIVELNPLDYNKAKEELLINDKLLHEEVSITCSEVLIKRNDSWYLKKRSKVLYFDINSDKNEAKFVMNSDSIHLNLLNIHKKANAHFIVLNYKSNNGAIEKQEIYDHFGDNVLSKFQTEDPPKRILVFVNGYRPTSLGQTFEENFSDMQVNGLEYPDSKNFIYDFDRYDYWQPWNEINLQFQKRLNPDDTYYADGHFSVSTSNYKSMINFSSISSTYPERCLNSKRHTCYKMQNASFKDLLFNDSKTISQLKMKPNRKGFNLRRTKGKIAGENLLQILNETPEYSRNDTLYIVAHSMGFAYSQGIVEKLRGKINFGGYYIIAPENGKSGRVIDSEWKQVWQYGSNLNSKYPDAPCLQDGIAPQYKVPGLPKENHIYIPKDFYKYKGYYDSHFIGFYTWILDIKNEKQGCVSKR